MPSIITASTASNTALNFSADTSGVLEIRTGSSPTTAMTIDGSQNVGIGVTPSVWRSTNKALQIGQSAAIFGYTASNIVGLSTNSYIDSAGNEKYITNGTGGSYLIGPSSGEHRWSIYPNNTSGPDAALTPTEVMRITSAGNVGIGTNSPVTRLDVNGIVTVRNNGAAFNTTPNTTYGLNFQASSSGVTYITSYSNGGNTDIAFATNSGGGAASERMRITSGGLFGFGLSDPTTFSSGVAQAVIERTSAGNNTVALALVNRSGTANTSVSLDFNPNTNIALAQIRAFRTEVGFGGATDIRFLNYDGSALSERVRINSNGIVGTTGPLSVGSLNGSVRQVSFYTTEMSMCPASGAGTNVFFNVSDNTGSNGSNYTFILRGLGSNGSVQNNLAQFTVAALTTSVQTLSKSGGSFRIEHPLPELKDTHDLVHSFVESPDANNIYRGVVTLVNGQATVNLDEVSRMTEGTFVLLNRDIQAFVSNQSDWDAVKASVQGNILTVQCQNPQSTASVSWLVIGMRQDKYMFDTDWTDDNGYVITEPLKKVTSDSNLQAEGVN